MKQNKLTIRAPRISLKQELKEKQPVVSEFSQLPPEHEFPTSNSTMSAGDFFSSLFSRNFLVTAGVFFALVLLVFAADSLKSLWKSRGRPHHLTAEAFELPPGIENPRVPVSGNPSVYNARAEACYIEGNKLLAAGSVHRAENMFRQAAEFNPDDQKYWDAWQALRREADFATLHRQMEALLEADRETEAWEAYIEGVTRDRRFFNRFTPDFAEKLIEAGFLASAASILMTYNELFPAHPKARQLLEKIRKTP